MAPIRCTSSTYPDRRTTLPLAYNIPVLCCRGVSTPGALQLLNDAGFSSPLHLHQFSTSKEYLGQLQVLVASGIYMVVNHSHTVDELSPESCWISPDLLNYLNNKGRLNELAPFENIPQRKLCTVGAIKNSLNIISILSFLN